jgi:hypothetical protein
LDALNSKHGRFNFYPSRHFGTNPVARTMPVVGRGRTTPMNTMTMTRTALRRRQSAAEMEDTDGIKAQHAVAQVLRHLVQPPFRIQETEVGDTDDLRGHDLFVIGDGIHFSVDISLRPKGTWNCLTVDRRMFDIQPAGVWQFRNTPDNRAQLMRRLADVFKAQLAAGYART